MTKVRRVTVRGIIFTERKLFCQVLKNQEGRNSFWCTPGGGLDVGEAMVDGLRRELIEETGVAPDIGRLLFTQQYADGDEEQLEFFFHITNFDDYKHINLDETSHGNIEVAEFGFVDPKSENVLPKPLQTVDIQSYIDEILPVLIINELP